MTLCAKCKKNPAVFFITKMENGKTTSEGLCLSCAKELGIAPINQMIDNFGVSDEELENINNQMSEFMESMEGMPGMDGDLSEMLGQISGGEDDEGGAATAPLDAFKDFFNNLGSNSNSDESTEENKKAKDKKQSKKKQKKTMLDTYGTNLTEKAARGEVDRVVNRDAEIERVIQILNRRSKNNPVLLGEPGVGKTAVAEGLACRIYEKNVPPKLFEYQLYLLDFTALVAGTQFRGQFEARLKSLLNEAAERGNVVLVIDEIHNIVAAGDAEGAMSAANILKPALARGEIQIIGATTLTEYRKHIEKDSALERRFQPVLIDEPSIDESIEILKGIKDYYENYHSVKISDDIIEQAVRLSERYITDRFLPDKAIDVIDEAGSRVNLKNKALYDVKLLEDRLDVIEEDIETATDDGDFEKIANLKTEKLKVEKDIETAENEAKKAEITFDDIAAVIEGWTKIPVHRLTEDESTKLLNLESRIHERVIGQNEAVEAVSRAIRRGRADITTRKRPVSFIFAGPTGVGKTELVKTIAEVMFDNEESLIRIDMSEYMEKHSVAKMIGSPPGYVGHDDGGQLSEQVRRHPYSVVLFDEIEKAHPDVFNILLQVLDDGHITDSQGRQVDFKNTILIMTSNAGAQSIISPKKLGFASVDDEKHNYEYMKGSVMEEVRRMFKPEFLNRIDETIVFHALNRENITRIAEILLEQFAKRCKEQMDITLKISSAAKELIAKAGFDEKYGARPLKRYLQKNVETLAAKLILADGVRAGDTIEIGLSDGKLTASAVHSA
mgnify:CR=1 FL=1